MIKNLLVITYLALSISAHSAECPFLRKNLEYDQVEAAFRTYENSEGMSIQLMGMVHIGDRGYYQLADLMMEGRTVFYERVEKTLEEQNALKRRINAIGGHISHVHQNPRLKSWYLCAGWDAPVIHAIGLEEQAEVMTFDHAKELPC